VPWLHSDTHLSSFFSDPEDIRKLSNRPFGTLLKEQGSTNLVQHMGHKEPVLRSKCVGPGRARTQMLFNSIKFKLHKFLKLWLFKL